MYGANIRRIRGLGGEKLPAASNAPESQTWKRAYFLPSERDRDFLSPVFYTAAPKRVCKVCIRSQAGARHLSPVVLWTLWPESGSEPVTSAPRSDFMKQSLFLSIDVCRGLGISPIRTIHAVEFFSGWSRSNIWPRIVLFCFLKFGFFCEDFCAHSERYRNLMAGIFEIWTFFGIIAFPLAWVLGRC